MKIELIEDRFEREVKECKNCKPHLFCLQHCREWDRLLKMKCKPINTTQEDEMGFYSESAICKECQKEYTLFAMMPLEGFCPECYRKQPDYEAKAKANRGE